MTISTQTTIARGIEVPERGEADAGLQKQHDQDLVSGVGGGRDGVGRKDRECDQLAQPLVFLLLRGDRLADEDAFQAAWHVQNPLLSVERARS